MATVAPPKSASTQKKGKKVPSEHPAYEDMIVGAVKALNDKKGSSRQAIVKYIKSNHKVPENVELRIKLALKRMEKKGSLTHTKGSGASGSFRVTESKKPTKKLTKQKPKKVKKPAAAKKTAKPKSTKKVKSPAKQKKSKPKTAKKATTEKKPKKPDSPKKAAASPKKAPQGKTAKNVKKDSPKKTKASKKGKKTAKK